MAEKVNQILHTSILSYTVTSHNEERETNCMIEQYSYNTWTPNVPLHFMDKVIQY